jgi:hypothetical protein
VGLSLLDGIRSVIFRRTSEAVKDGVLPFRGRSGTGRRRSPMRTLAPIVEWLPTYRRAWLSRDLVAGAAAWAVLVPLGLACSGILGVDPVMGL